MKTKLANLALGFVLGCSITAHAQELTAEQLTERAIHRRAVEAVIWGMPAVNYERMLQAAIDNGAKPNQVVYWSRPVNSKNQTLTPNPDTIYLNPFYETQDGPVVVEIPPAEAGQVIVGSFARALRRTTRRCRKIPTDRRTFISAQPRRRARSPTGCRPIRSGSSKCCSDSTALRKSYSGRRGSCRTSRKRNKS